MEIRYSIAFHPAVTKYDIPRLDSKWKEIVKKAIRSKLATRPEIYGKPLRQTLKHLYKLRAGDYRIIYFIEKARVIIVAIAHRSVVYDVADKRK